MRKGILLLFAVMFFSGIARAQFYKSFLPSPEFTNAIEKIVLDFRLNYKTIQGEQLLKQGDIETYESTIKLPGAKECVIYQYNSRIDTTASWQAIMYDGEDYSEAVKVYENVFRLVKKSQVKWIDRSTVTFKGEMEKATEEIGFTVSLLNLTLDDPRYDKFQAEIELVPSTEGWTVRLNLHSKPADTIGVSTMN